MVPTYAAPNKYNVLFGVTGPGPIVLEKNFRGTLIAPNADVTLPTATIALGHHGSIHARSITAHQHTDFYHHTYQRDAADCASVDLEGLGGFAGCPARDTDDDGLSDCYENNDDTDWTDPEVFNGLRVSLAEPCHSASSLLCADVDTREEIEGCLESASGVESQPSRGGAFWPPPGGSDFCSPDYGLGIDWTECREVGQAHFRGVLNVTEDKTYCFQLQDGSSATDPNLTIGALLLDADVRVDPILATDSVVCVEPPIGIHRLHWFYEFLGHPDAGFRVAVCTAVLGSTCDPLASLADWTRNDREGHDPDLTLRLPCDEDECALQCPCDSGEGTCESDGDCEAPAVCVEGNGPRHGHEPDDNVCEDPLCSTMATFLGCGFEGAQCGDKCSDQVPCSAGCPAGTVCGVNKGHLFGDVVADVCWPAECATDPITAGCGTLLSKCGVCSCEVGCAGKACGNDPFDGCGGYCTGLCDEREPGCTQDADCPGGFGCLIGGGPRVGEAEGTNVCLAFPCLGMGVQAPACGTLEAECGLCPAPCEPECSGRECGIDPKCGTACGSGCASGEYCSDSGQCSTSASDNDEPITVDDGNGGTRDIEPLDTPVANEVGATPGTFAVDALGNATYSIPIAVPPGRGGMEPQLAVRYSSGTGNDLLGIGWSLEGLSVISRCRRNLARDGVLGTISYDASDVYCLDGQRLVPVAGAVNDPFREYRTDIDSFAKIISYGAGAAGPDSFVVWTRDGRILSYGREWNSRSYVRAANGVVHAWALGLIEDRAGNWIDIRYNKFGEDVDGVTLEMVPRRLVYGGVGNLEPDRSVEFEYEKRPDADLMEGFGPGGAPFVKSLRLQRIDTLVKDAVVRSYIPQYEDAPNGVSRLKQLQECLPPASSPSCLPATQFAYHWEPQEFISHSQDDSYSVGLLPGIVFDPDGDGDHDLKSSGLWYNGGYRTLIGPYAAFGVKVSSSVALTAFGYGALSTYSNFMIDALNDALKDDDWKYVPPYLYRASGDRANAIDREDASEDDTCIDEENSLRSGAKPLRAAVDVEADGKDEVRVLCDWNDERECELIDPDYRPPRHSAPRPTRYPEWVVDLNGDGLTDHVRCSQTLEEDGNGVMRLGLRDPASADIEPPYVGVSVPRALCLPGCADVANNKKPTLSLDVDGDGIENLVFFDGGWSASPTGRNGGAPRGQVGTGWQALMFADGEAELVPVPGIPAPTETHDILVADINGDGMRDVVKLSNVAGDDPVTVGLNTGRGFIERNFEQADSHFRATAGSFRSWAFDYDGDGRDDILSSVVANPDDGSGYWLRIRLAGEDNQQIVTERMEEFEYPMPHLTADIDGDGNMDIVGATGRSSLRVYYGRGVNNNLLSTVVDGVGRRVDVEYSVDTSEDPECVSEWPIQCLPRSSHPLVQRYSERRGTPAGTAGPEERRHIYGYYSPRVGLGGHGWQGFSKVAIDEFRCVDNCGIEGLRTSSTVLKYEPVTPVAVFGGTVYPLAGKISDSFVVRPHTWSEIEDPSTEGLYDRQHDEFAWEVATSADGRPFAHLSEVYSETSLGDFDPESGELVSSNTITRLVDEYGNVYEDTDWSPPWFHGQYITFWPPDRDNWLIALPQRVINSSRYGEAAPKYRVTDYTFNGGLVETITVQPHDPELKLTTTLLRDEQNTVDHITYADTEGNLRERYFEYDDRGIFPLVSYDSRQFSTQYRYDERHGQVTLIVDPNGIETKYAYDGFGRLREVIGPEGHITFEFANAVDTVSATLPTRANYKVIRRVEGVPESESVTEYDSYDRVARTLTRGYEGQTVISENVYREGLLFRSARPHLAGQDQGYAEYAYDATNRLINVLRPDGRSEQRFYANSASIAGEHSDWLAWGATHVVASVATSGAMDVLVTDQRSNPLVSVDALGTRTDYQPDAFDATQRIDDAAGNTTLIATDAFARTTFLRDPARGDNQFVYSAFGETIRHVDGNDSPHEYFYDEVGRLERIINADGVTRFAYDGSGPNEIDRLVSATSPDEHVTEFDYLPPESNRNRGLLESIHRTFQGETFTETVEYDELSRILAQHYPGAAGSGFGVSYHYNPDHGYLEEVKDANTGARYWVYDSSYQGYRIEKDSLGNNTHTERTFDALTGQVQRIKTTSDRVLAQPLTIQDRSYTYDESYNLRSRSDNRNPLDFEDVDDVDDFEVYSTETYLNDPLDRLDLLTRDDSSEPVDYAYDAIGNLTQSTVGAYDYTQPNSEEGYEVIFAGSNAYAHDNNGSMTVREGFDVENFTQNITVNALDLPAIISMPEEQTVELKYSAFGERVAKLSPEDVSGVTIYAGDGYRREQPDPSADNYVHHYRIFVGDRQIAQVARAEIAGTIVVDWTQYLHHDLLDSVEVITDEDGDLRHSQQFDPFGNTDNPGWSSTAILTGFTGHEHDPDLGLINMKGRLYDPAIGRFISADPFVQSPLWSQGLNRYSYGYNNPMSGTDPSGYAWLDKVFGDSSGWQGAAFFAGGAAIVGGAAITAAWQSGALSDLGGSGAGSSAVGGGLGVAEAFYDLANDLSRTPNQAPTSKLGSGAAGSARGSGSQSAADIDDQFLRENEGFSVPDDPWPAFDARTEQMLSGLHPLVQELAREHLVLMRIFRLDPMVRSGFRTYADQDRIYAAGRTRPGPQVTKQPGGGSYHNFGLAYDVTLIGGNSHDYELGGWLGEHLRFNWGGRWKDPFDPGHFEYTGGYSREVLRRRYEMGLDVLGPP